MTVKGIVSIAKKRDNNTDVWVDMIIDGRNGVHGKPPARIMFYMFI